MVYADTILLIHDQTVTMMDEMLKEEEDGTATYVSLEEIGTDNPINSQIDAAYAAKYSRYARSIIDHINSAGARSATIKLVPR